MSDNAKNGNPLYRNPFSQLVGCLGCLGLVVAVSAFDLGVTYLLAWALGIPLW